MSEEPKVKVSRRKFVAGTVAGLAVGAAIGVAGGYLGKGNTTTTSTATSTQSMTATTTQNVTTTAQPWLPSKWDYTADVVILGTGLSGLSTAITAHDAGADVLVLEKLDQAHEGGNSKVSGNLFWAPADVTQGATYIKAMNVRQQSPDDATISALSAGLLENLSVIKQMGGSYIASGIDSPELTMLPGGSTVTMYGMDISGAAAFGGGHLWTLYRAAVASRDIQVMYSTPATGLIQNGNTGEILGVTALTGGTVSSAGLPSGGSTINIKASKGVVLACGGYEFNFDMQSQYMFGYPVYGYGTPGNTGDGIEMAQKAGAALWHMNQPSGGSPGVIVVPDYPYPVGLAAGNIAEGGYVWVGKDGNRFVNESLGFANHGWGVKEYGLQFNGLDGAFLRVPCWVVFDDKARASGPFASGAVQVTSGTVPSAMNANGWFEWYSGYTWSTDNSAEIAKGWITKADSIADLAAAIAADSDDLNPVGQPFMTSSSLQATITRFNGFVTSGADSDFGRPKATMASIATAPFYAVKLWPGMVNTNGGPKRNVSCQVVDPSGNPIPRLYGAGECGSFWGWMYQGGGNMGENMWTGRVAGKGAAGETAWS